MTCKDCYHYEACKDTYEMCFELDSFDKSIEMQNYDNMLDYCKLFKDKDKVIDLPCKVGDTVYVIYDGYVTSALILAFYIDSLGVMMDLKIKTKKETAVGFETIIDKDNYTTDEIYCSREEAEKALKELKE